MDIVGLNNSCDPPSLHDQDTCCLAANEPPPHSYHHPDATYAPSYPAHAEETTTPHDDPIPLSLVSEPFIYDPGNGPRVRNVPAFLASTFAAPPTLDDPLCAEFAQEEMLEMLCAVLPEETALVRRPVPLPARSTELTRARGADPVV